GLLRATITALGRLRRAGAAGRLVPHARSRDPEVRRAAMEALVRIGGEPGRTALVPLVEVEDLSVQRDAVAALGDLGDRALIPILLKAFEDTRLRPAAHAALVRIPDLRALDVYLEGLGGKDAMLREVCRRAIATIRD